MACDTIIQQGWFTSDGNDKIIALRSDVDWVKVYNQTNIAGSAQWAGTEWHWQREMGNNNAYINFHAAASQVLSSTTCAAGINGVIPRGISLIDSSANPVGALDATVTAASADAPPQVICTSTANLATGDIVRMINVAGAQQLGGIDFTITVIDGTTFSLDYMSTIVAALATTGSFRKISFDPLYYPRKRFISAVTVAASAVVTLTVTHGYTVGQKVRFSVPAAYGMTQLDGLQGTITAVAANTVTTDIDSSAFTAFAFPLSGVAPFTQALMMPIGEGAEIVAGKVPLDDATYNTGYIGFKLGAGSSVAMRLGSPGGTANDIIKWVAGKSFGTYV